MGKYKNSDVEAPKERIQLQGKSPKNEWWDEECRQVIKKKQQSQNEMSSTKTTTYKEKYKEREKKQIKYVNKKYIIA